MPIVSFLTNLSSFICARNISEDFMGMRRIICGSGNHTDQYQEIRNDRTHAKQNRFLLFVCVSCVSFALLVPQWASAQDESQCLPRCWERVLQDYKPFFDISASDAVAVESAVVDQECADACFNNETCIGIYWGFDPTQVTVSCWLQLPFQATSVFLKNAAHLKLLPCADTCFPYCWKPKTVNVHTEGGIYQQGVNTEVSCKLLCAKNQACFGADWNGTEPSCWLLYSSNLTQKSTPDPVHHWEVIRNLPDTCETKGALPAGPVAAPAPPASEPITTPVGAPMTSPAPVAEETASTVGAPVTNPAPVAGESSPGIAPAAGVSGNGVPRVGESNIAKGPAPVSGASGVGALTTPDECPNYLTGIIVLAVLMGICALIIIALIGYIISIRLEQAKSESLYALSNDSRRGYQSIRTAPDTTESSEAETRPTE